MRRNQPLRSLRPLPGRVALVALVGWVSLVAVEARPVSDRQPVTARSAMVATAHPFASQAGMEVLGRGGNAVDAAVAAAFSIGVVEPYASGIGGEGAMIVFLARTGQSFVIDYRSTAPRRAVSTDIGRSGMTSVAVPGTVAGLALALERFGSMSLAEVVAPAIRAAEEGFAVGPALRLAIIENFEEIIADEGLAALFCPDGLPAEIGTILRWPDLASTLRRIAEGGADEFYRGALARTIVAAIEARGGLVSADDLASYRAAVRAPIRGRYRGRTVLSTSGPTGGLAVVKALEVLDHFSLRRRSPGDAEVIHLVTAATRRGFADYRRYVGDPAFVTVPVRELLSRRGVAASARTVRRDEVAQEVTAGDDSEAESPSTTSLVAVDGDGNMVALTQTLSAFFGSRVMADGTGIILNNEARNFSRSGVNVIAAGKRMRTTIAPTLILRRHRPVAALGTPGAARIISTTVQLVVNLLDFRMDVQEAIDAARYSANERSADLAVEARVPVETRQQLERLGYKVRVLDEFDPYFGGAQAIVTGDRAGARWSGGADPRREGEVRGDQ